jgi:hypothetical protein
LGLVQCNQATVFERFPGAAVEAAPAAYRPRKPQTTVLHQVVREQLLSFLEQGQQNSFCGEGYPRYVEKEFRNLIGCGDLSRGFARVRCSQCGYERMLPFACKGRGICNSCIGRRMSEQAAYLVDVVLPQARYRQWTMTFPWHIRWMMAKDYKVITAVLGVCMRILFAYQRRCAKTLGIPTAEAKNAAVALVQRFGGALNLNVHLHVLMPDAVFVLGDRETFDVVVLPPPSDDDILRLTRTLKRRGTSLIERRFDAIDDNPNAVLDGAMAEAMQKVPVAPAQLVTADDDADAEQPDSPRLRRTRRAAAVDGFSIHANSSVASENRVGLEKLCRYGMRPPYATERLKLAQNGDVLLELRRPWPTPDGVSVLRFSPLDFLRRLAAIIPPPYAHTVRYFGLFAPNAKYRDLLPAAPVSWRGIRPEAMVLAGKLPDRTDIQLSPESTAAAEPVGAAGDSRGAPTHSTCDVGPARPAHTRHCHACPPDITDGEPAVPGASLHSSSGQTAHQPTAEPRHEQSPVPPVAGKRPPRTYLSWRDLLHRVFAFDVLVCPRCLGPMTVLAFLSDPAVVAKILVHLGLPTESPRLAPARQSGQMDIFDDLVAEQDLAQDDSQTLEHPGRGPPAMQDGDWTV